MSLSRLRSRLVAVVAVGVVTALLATGCSSSSSSSRSAASAGLGDPTALAALPGTPATGERAPMSVGAVLTPSSWVSTSLVPTLSVPGGVGAWTFALSDLSGGKSAFGTKTYAETGSTSRIPLGAGLQQGQVYTWTATSPGQQPVVGSFQVDVQQNAAQQTDGMDGVSVGLASGEASFVWSSHSVASMPGSVGFGLQFQATNVEQVGVPSGWNLQAASSTPYRQIETRADGTIALQSTTGAITVYREGPGGALLPVRTGVGPAVDTSGLAPVLARNADGSFAVTTKDSTAVFTLDGDTGFAYLSEVSSTDHPMLSQSWKSGRLQSITDPVSGRSVVFVYGGGSCPKPVSGFVAAPEGMLCSVKFWDGSTSSVLYVDTPTGPTIGRLVDFPEAKADGALVTDLAWDAAGRIATTRTPLVASAAASSIVDPGDPQFWTTVTYDASGRVASMTQNAAAPGATRCTRTYEYEGSLTQIADSCFGGPIMRLTYDPTTFFPLVVTNQLGQTSTNNWDLTSGLLLSSVDYQGLVSSYRYTNGNMVAATGPTRGGLSGASTTTYTYDQSFDASMGATAMRGLDVTYFPSATTVTADGRQELGPRLDDRLVSSLTVNWPSAPVGSGGWSAIMTGVLNVTTAGDYRIASNNSTARLVVNNVACVDGGCDALPLAAGANSIRIDVSSSSPAASMDLVWSGPDTGGAVVSIPTSALGPGYGLATTTESVDPTARRAPELTSSRSVYANPAKGQLSSRVNQAGQRTDLSYEGGNGGKGGWSRQDASIGAAGATYRYTYWGDKESAKSACPGATSANQGGAAKDVVAPGADGAPGLASTQWVDAGGRIVATTIPGGVVKCVTYGPDAQLRSVELLNTGSVWKVAYARSAEGSAIASVATETRGNVVTQSRSEVDLLGRPIRSVDRNGVETRTTYDIRTGEIATQTVTADGAAPTVTSFTYDGLGRLAAVSRDGRALATVTWNGDGTMAKVVYGNGVVVTQAYDDALRTVDRSWTTTAGAFANTRDVSAGGNLQGETYAAPSGASAFVYTHDEAGRLSAASVGAGLLASDRSWSWTFDASSNRTGQKVTEGGRTVGDWTYVYNSASQLLSSTDPSASAGIEWNDRGNATRVGPDSFTYDAANRLVSATDGTISVDYELDLSGNVVAKTVTGGPGAGTIRYATSGVLLDADSRPVAQRIDLPGGARFTAPLGSSMKPQWSFTALNGNEYLLTDDAGALTAAPQVFDPYGQRLTVAPSVTPGLPTTTWQADTGNETEALATPFQLMGARAYVPALGRFLQPDPKVGGSANQYDFASQDPVNLSDPSGEDVSDWVAPLATAAATVGAIFLFRVSSVKVGLAVGALIGVIGAAAAAAVDLASGNLSEWTAVRAGYTILAGLAAGGGTAAARNRWVKGAKGKQVANAAPDNPSSAGSARMSGAPDVENVVAPRRYTTPAARAEWESTYLINYRLNQGWNYLPVNPTKKQLAPIVQAAKNAANAAAEKAERKALGLADPLLDPRMLFGIVQTK